MDNGFGSENARNRSEIVREVILARRSKRMFVDDLVPHADLLELIEAGSYAPSGSNAQNQRFLLIEDKNEIERIGEIRWVFPYKTNATRKNATRNKRPSGIVGNAAALIIVFSDSLLTDPRDNGEYYIWEALEIQNCSASIENILLLATAKGIASCWVSASENMNYSRLLTGKTWRDALENYDIPESYKVQGVVLLGYPSSWDDKGYPRGEKMHGVSWQSVERASVDHYMISKKKSPADNANNSITTLRNLRIRALRKLIRFNLRVVRFLGKHLYLVEKR
ncbi:MAG: nitroreductase family protein [Candidatus Sedimenticola sp. (ex Thyasira tokunagai)]